MGRNTGLLWTLVLGVALEQASLHTVVRLKLPVVLLVKLILIRKIALS